MIYKVRGRAMDLLQLICNRTINDPVTCTTNMRSIKDIEVIIEKPLVKINRQGPDIDDGAHTGVEAQEGEDPGENWARQKPSLMAAE